MGELDHDTIATFGILVHTQDPTMESETWRPDV